MSSKTLFLRHLIFFGVLGGVVDSASAQHAIEPYFSSGPIHYSPNFIQEFEEPLSIRNNSAFTVLSRWAWGYCYAVAANGNNVFIGNGATFQSVDFTDTLDPIILCEYVATGLINDIIVKDDLAYVATSSELLILSVQNPAHVTQVGSLSLPHQPNRVVLDGTIAFVLSYTTGVLFATDISTPTQPFLRNAIAGTGEFGKCIAAKDGYVYLGLTDAPQLRVINATNPDSLWAESVVTGFRANAAAIRDTLLFLGTVGISYDRAFEVYSISQPSDPRLLSRTIVPGSSGNTLGINVFGTKAYAVYSDRGIVEFDVTSLGSPTVSRVMSKSPSYFPSSRAARISTIRNRLVVAYSTGVAVVSVAAQDSMKLSSFFPVGGSNLDLASNDSTALVASSLSGLWILDISNPFKIRAISNLQVGGVVSGVVCSDTVCHILIASSPTDTKYHGVWSLSIAHRELPRVVNRYVGIIRYKINLDRNIMYRSQNTLCLSQFTEMSQDTTVELIDMTFPDAPRRLGIATGRYRPAAITVIDSMMYVSTHDSGVVVWRVNPEGHLTKVGRVLRESYGMSLVDTLLVVLTDSLRVMNISDQHLPIQIGLAPRLQSNYYAMHLSAAKRHAYVSNLTLSLYDISNPHSPIARGAFATVQQTVATCASNYGIVLADAWYGIWLLRDEIQTSAPPSTPVSDKSQLFQNYPNPFNPITEITYEISELTHVVLIVYDILGREVATLINQSKEPGIHSVAFEGSKFPTGIYFYRLIAGSYTETKKMLLVR